MTAAERHPAVPAPARPYQGLPAGIVTRVAAATVDLVVVIVMVAAVYLAVAGLGFVLDPTSFHWPRSLAWSVPVIGFVIVVPYLTLTWCTTGRSYGGAVFGVRVVNARGERMRAPGAALRAVLCVIFPIGLFWVILSRRNRSVQDILLKTSAIYDWIPQITDDPRSPIATNAADAAEPAAPRSAPGQRP